MRLCRGTVRKGSAFPWRLLLKLVRGCASNGRHSLSRLQEMAKPYLTEGGGAARTATLFSITQDASTRPERVECAYHHQR